MKKLSFLLGIVMLLSSCGSIKKYNENISELHSVAELQEDIDFTHKKITKLHPDLYRYISEEKLDAKFDSLKKTINEPLSSYNFYMKLSTVIAEIKQGHTSVSTPKLRMTNKERKKYKDDKFKGFTFDFAQVEDKVFVTYTDSLYQKYKGAELVSIDNIKPSEIIKKNRPAGYRSVSQRYVLVIQIN